jgi:hypothetical protein
MGSKVIDIGTPVHLANLMVQSELLAMIKVVQLEDPECTKIKKLLEERRNYVLNMMGCSPILSKCVYQRAED